MDYKEIQFEFIENENVGLNKEQKECIKELIIYYTKTYTQVTLKTVCDFYSWDYEKNELDEYTYTHNRENEEYKKRIDRTKTESGRRKTNEPWRSGK